MTSRLVLFCNEIQKLEPKVGGVTPKQMDFIMTLLRNNGGIKKVLETGFHTGLSTATFLEVREDIEVVSFDIFWFDYTRKAKLLLDKYYPHRNLLIAGNSLNSLKLYLEKTKGSDIDLVFVDGGHEWPIPYYDLQILLARIKENTIVLIDDYCEAHGKHGVIEAVNKVIEMGLLKDIALYNFDDRGMICARRSGKDFSEDIPKEEIQRLLQDVKSHYE